MVNLIPKEETSEQELRERNKLMKKEEQDGASSSSTADTSSKTCPISGKEGECPMTAFMPAGAKSVLGRKSIKKSDDSKDSKPSILWSLCPVHMDTITLKVMAIVAIISWLCGFGSGFITRTIFF